MGLKFDTFAMFTFLFLWTIINETLIVGYQFNLYAHISMAISFSLAIAYCFKVIWHLRSNSLIGRNPRDELGKSQKTVSLTKMSEDTNKVKR